MPRSSIRTLLSMLVLVLALSACDMTVRLGTQLETDGSGRFSLGIEMDREMRAGLEQTPNNSLSTLQDLFDRLSADGWTVTTTQPSGGIAWEASRPFADSAEFDELIGEIGSAQDGTTDRMTGIRLEVDQAVERSFLRTNSRFSGVFDTTFGEVINDETRQLLQSVGDEVVRFEIKADLPGAVIEQSGDGTVRDGTVVWRPGLGTQLAFSAKGSSLNTGALMIVLLPALGLLGGGGWFVLGRRRGSAPVEPDPVLVEEIVAEQTPNGFLAIKPLERIDLAEAEPARDPDPV